MLVVFLIVPIWMLLFNMGYAGARINDAQTATRLASYEVLQRQSMGESANSSDVASYIENRVFPKENDVLTVGISDASLSSELDSGTADLLGILSGVMGSLSGNSRINTALQRESPFGLFANSDIEIAVTIGGTPYTFCEMDNAPFNPFTATDEKADVGLGILELVTESADIILAPFGGLPTGSERC